MDSKHPRPRILINRPINPMSKQLIHFINTIKRLRQRHIDRHAMAGDDIKRPEFEVFLKSIDSDLELLQNDLLQVLKREIDRIPVDPDTVSPSTASVNDAS